MEFDPHTYAIIGAAQHVHTVLGQGYLEYVYQCALARTLRNRGIPFEREVELPVVFAGPLDVGLLINFGTPRLKVQRFASPRLLDTTSLPSVDGSESATT